MTRFYLFFLFILIMGCSKSNSNLKNDNVDSFQTIKITPLSLKIKEINNEISFDSIPSDIDFGTIKEGSLVQFRLTLVSVGNISNLNVDGFKDSEVFLFKKTNCGKTMPGKRSCYVDIEFKANQLGVFEETISFSQSLSLNFKMAVEEAEPKDPLEGLVFDEVIDLGDFDYKELTKSIIITNSSSYSKNILIDSTQTAVGFSIGLNTCDGLVVSGRFCKVEIKYFSDDMLSEDQEKNSLIYINGKQVIVKVNHKKINPKQTMIVNPTVLNINHIQFEEVRKVLIYNEGEDISNLQVSLPIGVRLGSKSTCNETLIKNRRCALEFIIDPSLIEENSFSLEVIYSNGVQTAKIQINGSKQSEEPQEKLPTLIGHWREINNTESEGTRITFNENGTFLFFQYGAGFPPHFFEGQESGNYLWNDISGLLSPSILTDENGEWGFSHAEDYIRIVPQINGFEMYFYVGLNHVATFVRYTPEEPIPMPSIVGAWILDEGNESTIIYFNADGTYELKSIAVADESGFPGTEYGYYTWNAFTGEFNTSILTDGNGEWGFSHADGIFFKNINNEKLELYDEDEHVGDFYPYNPDENGGGVGGIGVEIPGEYSCIDYAGFWRFIGNNEEEISLTMNEDCTFLYEDDTGFENGRISEWNKDTGRIYDIDLFQKNTSGGFSDCLDDLVITNPKISGTFMLTACGNPGIIMDGVSYPDIVGVWQAENYMVNPEIIEFKNDGTYKIITASSWVDRYEKFNTLLSTKIFDENYEDGIAGEENGTYEWNYKTGEIKITSILSDTNGNHGFSAIKEQNKKIYLKTVIANGIDKIRYFRGNMFQLGTFVKQENFPNINEEIEISQFPGFNVYPEGSFLANIDYVIKGLHFPQLHSTLLEFKVNLAKNTAATIIEIDQDQLISLFINELAKVDYLSVDVDNIEKTIKIKYNFPTNMKILYENLSAKLIFENTIDNQYYYYYLDNNVPTPYARIIKPALEIDF